MIEIQHKNESYKMKSSLKEITTKEFAAIGDIFDRAELTTVDKYLESFKVLGLSNEVVNRIGSTTLIETIKALRIFQKFEELPRVIPFDGEDVEVYAQGEEFDLPAGKMSKIESAIRDGKGPDYVMAIILNLELTDENLEKVGELLAFYSAPYFAWLQINIVNNINELLEDAKS